MARSREIPGQGVAPIRRDDRNGVRPEEYQYRGFREWACRYPASPKQLDAANVFAPDEQLRKDIARVCAATELAREQMPLAQLLRQRPHPPQRPGPRSLIFLRWKDRRSQNMRRGLGVAICR